MQILFNINPATIWSCKHDRRLRSRGLQSCRPDQSPGVMTLWPRGVNVCLSFRQGIVQEDYLN
jgi:hypothetical protein